MGKCIRKYPGSDAGDRNGPFTRVATYTENNFEMNELLWILKNGLGKQMKSSDWRLVLVTVSWIVTTIKPPDFPEKYLCWHSNIDLTSPAQESWLVMAGTQSTPWIVDSCQFDLVQNSGKVLLFKIGRVIGEFDVENKLIDVFYMI